MTKNHINSSVVPLSWYLAVAASSIALCVGIELSPMGRWISRHVARQVEVTVRAALHRQPELDKRLKVYIPPMRQGADATIDLGAVLSKLPVGRPRMVLVDPELFRESTAFTLDPSLSTQLKLATGGWFGPAAAANPVVSDTEYSEKEIESSALLDYEPGQVLYPPTANAPTWFKQIGYADLIDDEGMRPARRAGKDQIAIHLSLLAASTLHFNGGSVSADGAIITPGADGVIVVNPPDLRLLADRIRPMADIDSDAGPREGDTVLLATRDRAKTYAILVNSVLSRTWIREAPVSWFLVMISGIFAACIAAFYEGRRRKQGLIVLFVALPVLGQCLFSFNGVSLPWLTSLGAATLAGGLLTFLSMHDRGQLRQALKLKIHEKVSEPMLADLLSRMDSLSTEASDRLLTFVAVELHAMAPPGEAAPDAKFHLKRAALLSQIKKEIFAHQGIIHSYSDKMLLAYFGATLDGSQVEGSVPTVDAINAALSIQQGLIELTCRSDDILASAKIGVETAMAVVGLLKGGSAWNFTVVSDAMGVAEQLKAGCNPYRILLGPKLADLAPLPELNAGALQIREMQASSGEWVGSLEVVPAAPPGCDVAEAEKRYSSACLYLRKDRRWSIPEALGIVVELGNSQGILLDYSVSGLMVSLDRSLINGSVVKLSLLHPDGSLQLELEKNSLATLTAVVRWARESAAKYGETVFLHGLELDASVLAGHRELLVGILTEFVKQSQRRAA